MKTTMEILQDHLPRMCRDGRTFAASLPEDPRAALDACEGIAARGESVDSDEMFLIRSACYELNLAGEAEFDANGFLVESTTPAGRLFRENATASVATLRAVALLRTWLEGQVK